MVLLIPRHTITQVCSQLARCSVPCLRRNFCSNHIAPLGRRLAVFRKALAFPDLFHIKHGIPAGSSLHRGIPKIIDSGRLGLRQGLGQHQHIPGVDHRPPRRDHRFDATLDKDYQTSFRYRQFSQRFSRPAITAFHIDLVQRNISRSSNARAASTSRSPACSRVAPSGTIVSLPRTIIVTSSSGGSAASRSVHPHQGCPLPRWILMKSTSLSA